MKSFQTQKYYFASFVLYKGNIQEDYTAKDVRDEVRSLIHQLVYSKDEEDMKQKCILKQTNAFVSILRKIGMDARKCGLL